jgi:hypothetical protein
VRTPLPLSLHTDASPREREKPYPRVSRAAADAAAAATAVDPLRPTPDLAMDAGRKRAVPEGTNGGAAATKRAKGEHPRALS